MADIPSRSNRVGREAGETPLALAQFIQLQSNMSLTMTVVMMTSKLFLRLGANISQQVILIHPPICIHLPSPLDSPAVLQYLPQLQMHYTTILLAAIYLHRIKDHRSGPGRRIQGMIMTSPLLVPTHPSGPTLPGGLGEILCRVLNSLLVVYVVSKLWLMCSS